MAVLSGTPAIQYSARCAQLSVHKLFTFCIRRGLVSRNSIVDGDTVYLRHYVRSKADEMAS